VTTLLRRPGPGPEPPAPSGRGLSAGSVGRRRPLPSGRAVFGGSLLAAAATLVLTAWLAATGNHGQRWVVARHDLATGARLGPDDLTTELMTLPKGATAAGAFHSPTALSGRILAAPVLAGELVQQGALVRPGEQPDLRPVTITLDAADTTDLSSGTLVDVLVTEGSGTQAATSVVLRGAQVLDVAAPSSSLLASTSGDDVTLGVSTLAEVEAVVHAAHTGTLSVVVGEHSDGAGLGPVPAPHPEKAGAR
jgi:pilus assembly protein CpaB